MLSYALKSLSQYQRKSALQKSVSGLGCLNPRIVDNRLVQYDADEYQDPSEDHYLAVYKCLNCGALIVEDEEVGELGECKCGKNYLGLDEE